MPKPSAKEIWQTLSKIDVSDQTDKKGGLTYLSWAWAWGVLKDHYPEAEYEFREWTVNSEPVDHVGPTVDCMVYEDGSASVHCKVSIGDVTSTMWLPVMDYRNKAIPKPDARSISDSKMRCLVKCIAMLGLGHYIYAGEDLPDIDSEKEKSPSKEEETNKVDEAEESATLPDGEEAMTIIEVFMEDVNSVEELQNYYRSNSSQIKEWAETNGSLHKKIMDLFKSKKAELNKESK
mgnify:CR=1 FL=1